MKKLSWSTIHTNSLILIGAIATFMLFQVGVGLQFKNYDPLIFIIASTTTLLTVALGLSKYFIWYARNYESNKEDLEALK